VKRVEQFPKDLTGKANPAGAIGTTFMAMLTGADISGTFFDWVKVQPAANRPSAPDAMVIGATFPLWTVTSPAVGSFGTAREVNGNLGIAPETIVELKFLGYDTNDKPVFVFNYNVTPLPQVLLPVHDHRDNVTGGGFAFAVFHPGTDLPQSPFSV
jgi:hypothetical protein